MSGLNEIDPKENIQIDVVIEWFPATGANRKLGFFYGHIVGGEAIEFSSDQPGDVFVGSSTASLTWEGQKNEYRASLNAPPQGDGTGRIVNIGGEVVGRVRYALVRGKHKNIEFHSAGGKHKFAAKFSGNHLIVTVTNNSGSTVTYSGGGTPQTLAPTGHHDHVLETNSSIVDFELSSLSSLGDEGEVEKQDVGQSGGTDQVMIVLEGGNCVSGENGEDGKNS